ncbi:MAG: acetylornithine deacetylase [Sphingobacteriales bacterium UTBCD1]|jgi:acetylornithine deacetylase|nr:MAG: acetylornithine deacetylase [Sphingobacteriales bacterium UTBCD1]
MNPDQLNQLYDEATGLLKKLIATPSFSREEDKTSELLENFFKERNILVHKHLYNVWAKNKFFDERKPTLLLNSHHDTVKPNSQYTKNPFNPIIEEGKLFGLGSNDAGGSLVSLIAAFLYFHEKEDLKYNLILAASAEEEISGINGIESLLNQLGPIDCSIVGEPTQMQMAVAERGLMVLDCIAKGKAGHAARKEGENAIYKAIKDIEWLTSYKFPKVSGLLGPVNMDVTVIETDNKAHNVVPAQCKFVVDVRVNELYTFEEIFGVIKANIASEVKTRSFRLRSTAISLDHPLVQAGLQLGRNYYGSPTTSDKALMPFPALKMGPGDSGRSHSADEYIYVEEIREGIGLYIQLLEGVL